MQFPKIKKIRILGIGGEMTEEEIKELKALIKEYEIGYKESKNEGNVEDYESLKETHKLLKDTLNSIEKLQKENEESKELYDKLFNGYNKLVQEHLELEKENIELKKDISNMYNKEVVISIICDNFDVTRLEALEMLGEEE